MAKEAKAKVKAIDESSKTKTRRKFLGESGALAAASLTIPAAASAQTAAKKFAWDLVTAWPKDLPGYHSSLVRMTEQVSQMSEGRLTIKIRPGGELCKPFECFDFVSKGSAQMGNGVPYYWRSKSEAFQFFATIPFGFTSSETEAWIHHGGGRALATELYDSFGLVYFPAGGSGCQMGGWFNKEINSINDFKGLKIRYPAFAGDVLKKHGAIVTMVPAGEIYSALKSGQIDAAEWVGPWNDYALKLYESAKFYYWPSWHEPGTVNDIFVNKTAWNSLPKDLKAILTNAIQAMELDFNAELSARNNGYLSLLLNSHKVQLKRFSDETLTELAKTSKAIVEEAANKDPMTKKVFQSYTQFRYNVLSWGSVAEGGYMAARANIKI